MRLLSLIVVLVLLAVAAAEQLIAQAIENPTVLLEGQVLDADGRGMPGVALLVTGPRRVDLRSDRRGLFSVIGLPAGNYTLEVSHPGYMTHVQEELELDSAGRLFVRIRLEQGSASAFSFAGLAMLSTLDPGNELRDRYLRPGLTVDGTLTLALEHLPQVPELFLEGTELLSLTGVPAIVSGLQPTRWPGLLAPELLYRESLFSPGLTSRQRLVLFPEVAGPAHARVRLGGSPGELSAARRVGLPEPGWTVRADAALGWSRDRWSLFGLASRTESRADSALSELPSDRTDDQLLARAGYAKSSWRLDGHVLDFEADVGFPEGGHADLPPGRHRRGGAGLFWMPDRHWSVETRAQWSDDQSSSWTGVAEQHEGRETSARFEGRRARHWLSASVGERELEDGDLRRLRTGTVAVSDRWLIGSRWALFLGGRWQRRSTDGGGIESQDDVLLPRAALSWDPFGDGQVGLHLNIGRVTESGRRWLGPRPGPLLVDPNVDLEPTQRERVALGARAQIFPGIVVSGELERAAVEPDAWWESEWGLERGTALRERRPSHLVSSLSRGEEGRLWLAADVRLAKRWDSRLLWALTRFDPDGPDPEAETQHLRWSGQWRFREGLSLGLALQYLEGVGMLLPRVAVVALAPDDPASQTSLLQGDLGLTWRRPWGEQSARAVVLQVQVRNLLDSSTAAVGLRSSPSAPQWSLLQEPRSLWLGLGLEL